MTIVYTTIFGGCDSLKPAPAGADRCVCFVDDVSRYPDAKGWELVAIGVLDARREAWHLRAVSHRLFPEAARTVWVDASFTITDLPRLLRDAGKAPIAALRHHERHSCYDEAREIVKVGQATKSDVWPQMHKYKERRFRPEHLSISCILVRANTQKVTDFNETWDTQIRTYRGDNTQLSLDYSAWVNGLRIEALQGSRLHNPYGKHAHRDHKRRRKPYDTEVAA